MARKPRVPKYLLHKSSGQARVFIPRPGGGYDERYLGPYGSPESRAEYARVIAELAGIALPKPEAKLPSSGCSVNELILAYWRHAEAYYRGPDGKGTAELDHVKLSLRMVRQAFGETPAADFGPVKLAAVREGMVARGWCRRVVNARVDRIRRCFKWAVAQELLPGDRYEALRTLPGLRRGRTSAPESEPVPPADLAAVKATLPHLPRVVRAMVELQRWTGMRPQDVCYLKRAQINREGTVWTYEPTQHKSAHRGLRRIVHFGPRAQSVLRPFLDAPGEYVFSAAEVVADAIATRTANRRTSRYPSHMVRNAEKRKADRKRPPRDHYSTDSYGKAVAKGIARANAWRACMAAGAAFDPVPAWTPNQLRHLRGTEVRKAFGLEAAQVSLDHARADVTQIYAERDRALAAKVAAESG